MFACAAPKARKKDMRFHSALTQSEFVFRCIMKSEFPSKESLSTWAPFIARHDVSAPGSSAPQTPFSGWNASFLQRFAN
jgi:hypothetical protein